MAVRNLVISIYTIIATVLSFTSAQAPTGTSLIDVSTNMTFSTWSIPGSNSIGPLTFGLALHTTALETDASEFIGYLQCAAAKGWCGISLGGSMTDSLLLVAYADPSKKEKDVQISPRYTTKYSLPQPYEGNATVNTIRSEVTDAGFTTIFHCQDCLHWAQGESKGGAKTSSGTMDLAYAISPETPTNAACAHEAVFAQHKAQGTWVAFVDSNATSTEYEGWAKLRKGGGAGAGDCSVKA
ncbi:hypothetical protein BJY04DRAFT_221996 [Aspergillus karnatakaensis]|uniref:uncharacterized protein n=1 Tax=Aspergillus karnatakaensis TaxID=1810916 RepID=UPI003CCDB3F0